MFRKAALAKLASPEQLDSLMQVTTPKGWMALGAALVVIFAALIWGIFGRTAELVNGAGILLKEGGLFSVEARGNGVVKEVLVNAGDTVQPGQIVLRVSLPEVEQELKQTEALIEDLKQNRVRSSDLLARNRDAELRSVREERNRTRKATETLVSQIEFLEQRLKAQTTALEGGLITRDVRQATVQELEQAKASLIANQSQVAQLEAREASTRNQADQGTFNLEQEVRRTERQLEQIKRRLQEGSEVTTPHAGRVVSRAVDPGQEVRQGMPVVNIEVGDAPIQAVAFIPLQGGRIQPGMTAQLSPEGVKWEEYGYMLGDVVQVLQTPANAESMNRVLRNQQLITQFTASGSVYEMRIKPREDKTTTSGFAWTSRAGPPLRLGSGTLIRVQIAVDEKRPIEMVIPTIRGWIGI
jgi:HlyD family secretion protein